MAYTKYLTTEYPNIFFEDNKVGRLKKRIWDASEEEIQAILDDYGIGTPLEMGVAGTYIQNTPRAKLIEKRRQNDIVLCPSAPRRTMARRTAPVSIRSWCSSSARPYAARPRSWATRSASPSRR